MSKAVFIPIIGLFALIFKAITGVDIDEATQTEIANVIYVLVAGGMTVWGIFKNLRKKVQDNKK